MTSLWNDIMTFFGDNELSKANQQCNLSNLASAEVCLVNIATKYPGLIPAQKFGPSSQQQNNVSQVNVNHTFPNQQHAGAILDKTGQNVIGTVGTNAVIQQLPKPIPIRSSPPPLPTKKPTIMPKRLPPPIPTHVGSLPIVLPTDSASHDMLVNQTLNAPVMSKENVAEVKNMIPDAPPMTMKIPDAPPMDNHPVALSFQHGVGITPLIVSQKSNDTTTTPKRKAPVDDLLNAIRSGVKLRGANAPSLSTNQLVSHAKHAISQNINKITALDNHNDLLRKHILSRGKKVNDDDDDF